MKNNTFFIVAIIILLLTSCGSSSMSKSEALQMIIEQYGEEDYSNISFPVKAVSIEELGAKLDGYKQYETAGLLKIENTDIRTYKNYMQNQPKTTPAVLITLTDLGKQHGSSGKTISSVKYYAYKYNNVVDVKLIKKYENPADKKQYMASYLVFITGNITQASPFAAVDNIKVGDRYPITYKDEPAVFMSNIEITCDHGEVTRKKISRPERIDEKAMNDKYNKYKNKMNRYY